MSERSEFWSRSVRYGPVLFLGGVLVWALLLPDELRSEFREEQRSTRLVGPSTAPAPNLPGRLDGRSVGSRRGHSNSVAGAKWRALGEQINSGGLSRVPSEAELTSLPEPEGRTVPIAEESESETR